NKLKPSQWISL
uniref:Ovary-derived ACE interactive factor n=2 Tax=Sarcophaga bullata TaxID=7385 RepID=ODAIF_SARBU|nr:RecName: Full=Ovary-derived ACE interactive factor; AltName: Full=Neb-ODAIF; Contains: RecName: Full=Neb-ODAIF(1-9); Contains: RecName: Full=Neb-ODAIF(1-7) [Sarcophaga bullata]